MWGYPERSSDLRGRQTPTPRITMPGERETLSSDVTILPQGSVLVGLCIGKTRSGAREQGSLFGVGHPGQPPRHVAQ